MASLQFSIDNICANFTVESLNSLVKERLSPGPCTIDDIAREIVGSDRSLGIKRERTPLLKPLLKTWCSAGT